MTSFVACSEADRDHTPISREQPAWPHAAMLLCLEGSVVLECTVGSDGRVHDASVIEATHPGIFDRAAIAATQTWSYQPRCESGMAVEARQRTALDFRMKARERAHCLPGARLLEGEAIELVAALGILYSVLGEWQYRPQESDWRVMFESAMVPSFGGDLGQVERFHHEFVDRLVDMARYSSLDKHYLPMPLLGQLINPGPSTAAPDEATLSELRRNVWEWTEQVYAFGDWLTERYAALRSAVSLDPDLLDVLVHGFIGDPTRGVSAQSAFAAEILELTESLLGLLEDPTSPWQLQPEGIRFDHDSDQAQFMQLANHFAKLEYRAGNSHQQFWSRFVDYRP
ncbi:MAG: energy transducer TonB [Wenzhouxiangella sp.]|nr:energy transducer TonB [Wenzhouxiangella sp.]